MRTMMVLLLALTGLPAGAADIQVTRLDDPAGASCSIGDCSLRAAVGLANQLPGADRILLPAGPAILELSLPPAGFVGNADGDLYITGPVEILGGGMDQSTIRQSIGDRIVRVEGDGAVVFRDLTLAGGRTETSAGGALLFTPGGPQSRLLLERVRLRDNRADYGAALYASGYPAVGLQHPVLEMRHVEVLNNRATGQPEPGRPPRPYSAAAVALAFVGEADRTVVIQDSLFQDNQSDFAAGALWLQGYGSVNGPQLLVIRSRFVGNRADVAAVGAYVPGGGAIVGPNLGGGFSLAPPLLHAQPNGPNFVMARASIEDSEFIDNHAKGPGGALSGLFQRVTRSRFIGNAAGDGGALAGGAALIRDSTFCDNRADLSGGALRLNHPTLIRASTFCGNTVAAPGDGRGGAVSTTAATTIERSTFDGNQAARGSALFVSSGMANTSVRASTLVGADAPVRGGESSLLEVDAALGGAALQLQANLIQGRCALAAAGPVLASNNLESPGDTCGLSALQGNQVNVPPGNVQLAPLANLGDPTPVRLPMPGSALIDFVPLDQCLLPDQRGYAPTDGGCDAGAVERSALASDPLFDDGFEPD